MNDSAKNRTIAIGIIAAGIILSLIIPMSYWSAPITSGRWVSEGVVVDNDKNDESMIVRLCNPSANGRIETSTFLKVKGNVPADCFSGQDVMIGYSKQGLYEDVNQKVEISFKKNGNIMTGYILPHITFRVIEDFTIIDIASDGTFLNYYVAA